ncbi:MAG: sensor histidine kinase, partial [Gorillibacterium sp.]|nr:sensor histidine kinase [Gorillibacterium sp.]
LYHGIEQMVDVGLIRITAKRQGEDLLFVIEDNGVGISAKHLEKLRSGQAVINESENSSGVGLGNVRERIRLYYGKPYGIHIESALEEGTRVSICIPLVKEEQA